MPNPRVVVIKPPPKWNQPKKKGNKKQQNRPRNPNSVRDSNTVLLLSPEVAVNNTVYPYSALNVKMNVNSLMQTGAQRLASFMDLYDEFKFIQMRLRWEPALPSTTTGQIAMYYDPDPSAETPAKFQDVSGNKFLQVGHIAKRRTMNVPKSVLNRARYNWFTRKSNGVDGTQGCFILAASAGTVPHAVGKVTLGSLWLDYTILVRAPTSKPVGALYNFGAPPVMYDQVLHQDAMRLNERLDFINTNTQRMAFGMVYKHPPGVWAMRQGELTQLGTKPPADTIPESTIPVLNPDPVDATTQVNGYATDAIAGSYFSGDCSVDEGYERLRNELELLKRQIYRLQTEFQVDEVEEMDCGGEEV